MHALYECMCAFRTIFMRALCECMHLEEVGYGGEQPQRHGTQWLLARARGVDHLVGWMVRVGWGMVFSDGGVMVKVG